MKILAWTCRGLTRASAIRSLRVKVRKYSPDVLFLFETKTTVDGQIIGLVASWISLFPSFSLRHLPDDSSDHNPLILYIVVSQLSIPKPFKFEEFWIKHQDCLSVIVAAWAYCVTRSPGFILIKKLKSVKHTLKIWNHLSFGNIQK